MIEKIESGDRLESSEYIHKNEKSWSVKGFWTKLPSFGQ